MPFVTSKEMLLKAQREGYAVGAFNAENMEMVQAIIEAAEEEKAPVIIQTTPSTIAYANVRLYRAMVQVEADKASVPVAIHLDHGDSYELCKEAIAAKYTSVMIDGSKLSFEENIAVTKKVVEATRKTNIGVEAELGTIGGKEDSHEVLEKDALYTNPQQAEELVCRTGVQSLAVAIGTAHGFYKGEPKLDFECLAKIAEVVKIPLVLHGASGVPDEAVKQSIRLGICKVNFATELRVAYTQGVRSILSTDDKVYDPKKYGTAGRATVKVLVQEKIRVCGSSGKA